MNKQPQKSSQLELPLAPTGEAVVGSRSGEALTAQTEEPRSGTSDLMQRAIEPSNMLAALKRVRRNGGGAGVDRMSVDQLPEYLRQHWPTIRKRLLDGTYEPGPVRTVEIAKPSGGTRKLSIPTVLDRLIQQSLLQVLQPIFDASFSEYSYGFRPGRSAHQALKQARDYVASGKAVVVDVDLEKFFDHVDHDMLMSKLAKQIADKRMLILVRRYLRAGTLSDGMLQERREGTPQGGPLSPLLANVMLDEMDKLLEQRGRAFVRYADDCNVYVANERVGQRVLAQMRKVYARLKLRINENKTAVAAAESRKLLGYTIRSRGRCTQLSIAQTSMKKFKDTVRKLTTPTKSQSIATIVSSLAPLMRGWGNYFALSSTEERWKLEQWICRRLRMLQIRAWGSRKRAWRGLRALGIPARKLHFELEKSWGRHWHWTDLSVVRLALPTRHFQQMGLPSMLA